MSEYIGSRISLISKSDIKYVGTLHEINSDSHTVALESVTSYGTEGRKGNPAEELAGSDQVYEYIVFRGSDVKELTIVAPPGAKENQAPPKMPDDPAILGSARPGPPGQPQYQQPPTNQAPYGGPQSQFHQQPPPFGYSGPPPPNAFPPPPRFQGPGGPHGFPGTPGAVPGYGMGFPPPPPGYYGPPPGQGFGHQPPPNFPQDQHMQFGAQPQPPPEQHAHQPAPPSVGSKQATPKPGADGPLATQTPPVPQKPAEKTGVTAPPPLPVDSKPSLAAPSTQLTAAESQAAQRIASRTNRVAVPLPATKPAAKPPQKPIDYAQVAARAPTQTAQPQSIADATQAATAAVAAAMAKLGPVSQGQDQPAATGVDNLAQKVNQMRLQDQQRGRGRDRGRGGPPRGGRRENTARQIDVPKEDFDFESANAKFNKQELVKEAIATGSPVGSPNGSAAEVIGATNGEANGKKDASEDVVIPPSSSTEKGYDKKSSFFDNISSDLKDRTEHAEREAGAIDGRTLRREERSKNMETFGQGSVDQGGYRGGFRGRGRGGRGFGQYPRGGGYRGGHGGPEHRGGGYRGRGGRGAAEPTFA